MENVEPPDQSPAYLKQVVNRLRSALGDDLGGIVLYGSHARGEARPGSDVDLLVIARGLPERRYERAVQFQAAVRGIDDAPEFSILGKTPDEFEGYFPSLYLDIGLDGRLLFDQAGYTANKLQHIRDIIARAGLVRLRNGGEMFWNWKRPPARHWEITWDGFRELA